MPDFARLCAALTPAQLRLSRNIAGGVRVGRPRKTANFEHLESREMLTAGLGLPVQFTTEIGSGELTFVPEGANDPSPTACPEPAAQVASDQRLPAPIIADYNVDGFFTSADFVEFFRDRTQISLAEFDSPPFDISEQFDLLTSMQWVPYETESVLSTANPCGIYEMALDDGVTNISRQDRHYDNSSAIQQSTVRFGAANKPSYRATYFYDREEKLTSFALSLYRSGEGTIYSRLLSNYDTEGRISNHSTWIYTSTGTVQRVTTTAFWYFADQVLKSTAVDLYDELEQKTSRRVYYYDNDGDQVSIEYYDFAADGSQTISRSYLDTRGNLDTAEASQRKPTWTDDFVPTTSEFAYLIATTDEFEATRDAMNWSYQEILRMNPLSAQQQIESILNDGHLTPTEADRYRQLNQYFFLSLDLATSLQQQEFQTVYSKYGKLIDVKTGDWTQAFKDFVQREHLTLPFAPFKMIGDPHQLDVQQRDASTARYENLVGTNPVLYFQPLRQDVEAHVQQMLESMRRVKALIKVQDFRTKTTFPVFDWLSRYWQADARCNGPSTDRVVDGLLFLRADGRRRLFERSRQ